MQPTELRLSKAAHNGHTFYTVNKVWPGVANVSFGRKFMTYLDAVRWAKTEWPMVPLIKDY